MFYKDYSLPLHPLSNNKHISRSGAVVARWAHNPKVVSSSLASATIEKRSFINLKDLFSIVANLCSPPPIINTTSLIILQKYPSHPSLFISLFELSFTFYLLLHSSSVNNYRSQQKLYSTNYLQNSSELFFS